MCRGLRNRAKPVTGQLLLMSGCCSLRPNALFHNDGRKQRRLGCSRKQSRHYTMIRLFWRQKTWLVPEIHVQAQSYTTIKRTWLLSESRILPQ